MDTNDKEMDKAVTKEAAQIDKILGEALDELRRIEAFRPESKDDAHLMLGHAQGIAMGLLFTLESAGNSLNALMALLGFARCDGVDESDRKSCQTYTRGWQDSYMGELHKECEVCAQHHAEQVAESRAR